ncbi:MAG: tetratricopeptide repeat protein [Acidobacteria bacterium]|nr:tetratricopeptide repeat protein [Acidobacteriota bacterium]
MTNHRTPPRHLVLVPVLALAGLGLFLAAGAVRAESIPGEPWIRAETAHFSLLSGAGEATTRRVGGDLEILRAALSSWLGGLEVQSPVPTTIYVFPDDDAFAPYKQGVPGESAGITGYFVAHTLGNYVAMDGDSRSDPTRILYHEYLHYFVANNLPGVPLWFNEGLAELYSTFEARGDRAILGLPIASHVQWLRRHRQLALESLLAVDKDSPEYNESSRRGGFYAQSWALVHYLLVGNPERSGQLFRFLELVAGDTPTEEAFESAFGVRFGTLERELQAYLAQPELPLARLPVAGLEVDRGARIYPLSHPELLARLGELLIFADPNAARRARSLLDNALDLDPRLATAWTGLGLLEDAAGGYDDARGYYERARQLAPSSFLVQYLYGRSLLAPWTGRRFTSVELEGAAREDLDGARRAFEKSLELNPDFPEAWVGLGAVLTLEPQPPAAAVDALEHARRMLPSRPDVVFNLAVLYARTGQRSRAEALIDGPLTRLADDALVTEAREQVLRAEVEGADRLIADGRGDEALALLERIAEATTDGLWRAELERHITQVREVLVHNRDVDRYNRAVQSVRAGREAEAVETLEALLETRGGAADVRALAQDLLDRLKARRRR